MLLYNGCKIHPELFLLAYRISNDLLSGFGLQGWGLIVLSEGQGA